MGPVYYFLRFDVKRNGSGLLLTQNKYAQELLEKARMEDYNRCLVPLVVACKRVLRYVKGTLHHGLIFKQNSHFRLEAYADADRASDINNRRSTSGYAIFLGDNLVQWSSRKQKVVSLYYTEAEYRALSQAATALSVHRFSLL
ncbi:uncharacterized protein LOC116134229 [Pistacia vera]|uniref:uncharacterized protein LOC116134229 n=1 Tax=Pistacia vera TaxID=55513 RepID=UPI001262FBAE|nr:uncharacterized protein LOC116134229 [Pistacia vera]